MGIFIFEEILYGHCLRFAANEGVFSPRKADPGSLALLQHTQFQECGKILDLGCGYGLIGIAAACVAGAAHVCMVDSDPEAVRLAKENALQNGFADIRIVCGDGVEAVSDTMYDLILSNPPYHTDFSVAKRFIEKGFHCLNPGGRMMLVVKRLPWYQNKMASVFGGVRVIRENGYYVLCAEKRSAQPKSQTAKKEKQTTAKHRKRMLQSAAEKKTKRNFS